LENLSLTIIAIGSGLIILVFHLAHPRKYQFLLKANIRTHGFISPLWIIVLLVVHQSTPVQLFAVIVVMNSKNKELLVNCFLIT